MRVRLLVLATVLLASLPVGAQAADPPSGEPCELVTTAYDAGVLRGGPVTGSGTLTCTVQLGTDARDGADVVTESSSGDGVVVLEPRTVSFPGSWERVYVCTVFTAAGGTRWYWSPDAGWTTDSSAACGIGWPGVRELVQLLNSGCDVDLCLWPPFPDSLWCPVMASLATLVPAVPGVVEIEQDGDTHVAGGLLWDCPPYDGS